MMSAREGQPSLSGQFWYSVVDGIKDGLAEDSKLTLEELRSDFKACLDVQAARDQCACLRLLSPFAPHQ